MDLSMDIHIHGKPGYANALVINFSSVQFSYLAALVEKHNPSVDLAMGHHLRSVILSCTEMRCYFAVMQNCHTKTSAETSEKQFTVSVR